MPLISLIDMGASVCIAQKGIVEEVTSHKIRVKIYRESTCGNCSAQSICNLTNISERIIEIHNHDLPLKSGDFVDIVISQRLGNRAVQKDLNLLMSVIYAAAIAAGFTLALILMAGIREQLSLTETPKGMKGFPISLVTAGLLSLAFMGFSGIVK